ncbi:MAG: hypothetical protein ACFFBD_12520 [Candidatus Hodarchaeota archaeon]
MNNFGVIVLGVDSATGLGVIRSLGKNGLRVIAGDDTQRAIGFYSKYVKDSLLLPSDKEKTISTLLKFGLKKPGWVIIPTTDYYVTLVSQKWEELSKHFILTTAPWHIVRFCIDKLLTYKIAKKAGIPTPQTYCPRNEKELKKIANGLDFRGKSWILKSRSKVLFPNAQKGLFHKGKAVEATSKKDLLELYHANIDTIGESALVQERIPGMPDRNVIFQTVINQQSQPVVVSTEKKIRQLPLFFGVGSYRESIAEPIAIKFGLKLLNRIGYYGMAYVEFKRDPRDGQLKLMEINPRFTMGISLAKACGINFALILYNTFLNIQDTIKQRYKIGIRWWNISYDLYTILTNRKYLPWRKTFRDIVSNKSRTQAFAYLSREDPFPFLISLNTNIKLMRERR